MSEKMKSILVKLFLSSGTKRLVTFIVTMAVIFLNNKLGLDLDPTEIASAAILALGYITQSSMKETKIEKAKYAAAAAIPDRASAVAALNKPFPSDAPLIETKP